MSTLRPSGWPSAAAALTLTALAVAGCGPAVADISVEAARAQTEAWRATHEADYRREWVTIAGLHFLSPGAQSVGSAPDSDVVLTPAAPATVGRFTLDGQAVRFEPTPGVEARLRGAPVTQSMILADDGTESPDELVLGRVRLAVHRSGARKSLRVWDPEGPLAKGFLGFRWFDIDPAYRTVARFVRDAAPRAVKVTNTFGDVDEFQSEGVLRFTLQGVALSLRPFTTAPNRFYIVFKDASSGSETYGAARFLYADLRPDDTAVLDFNQAYNPPCAFNPYTTCPIPLAENRLPVKVLAGERDYPTHVALPKF